jgi:hypothetical protein
MAIKHNTFTFVETPRKFITSVIHLRGVSTNKKYYNVMFTQFTHL